MLVARHGQTILTLPNLCHGRNCVLLIYASVSDTTAPNLQTYILFLHLDCWRNMVSLKVAASQTSPVFFMLCNNHLVSLGNGSQVALFQLFKVSLTLSNLLALSS